MTEKCESCGKYGAIPEKFSWPETEWDKYTLYLCQKCWDKTMEEWNRRKRNLC